MKRYAARFSTGIFHSMNPWCVTYMVTQLGWDLLVHRRDKNRMNPMNPGCVTYMVTQLGWDLLVHRTDKNRMNPMNPGCVTYMVTQLGWDLLVHRRDKNRMNPMNPGCVTYMVTQLGWDLLVHRTDKNRMNPMNPGCVTYMVTQLGWDLLEHRRAKNRIAMCYKIINNIVNIPVHHQLKVHDSSTLSSGKLYCYKYSSLPANIVSWNTLLLEVRKLPSLLFELYACTLQCCKFSKE